MIHDNSKMLARFLKDPRKACRKISSGLKGVTVRSTEQLFSVKYLFGEANIASNFLFLEDNLKFLHVTVPFMYKFRSFRSKFPKTF